jgi:riboflavin-specific deaminase-like protein
MGEFPYVTVSYAQSLDGKLATSTGDSKWISCEQTLRLGERLRRENRGILIGVGTALRDDPKLTCRIPHKQDPVRIILDSKLSLPLDCTIAQTALRYRTIIFTTRNALKKRINRARERGLEIITTDETPEGFVDLPHTLKKLAIMGVDTLLVEGGARVITSFFRTAAVSRLIITIAPIIIGEGISAIGDIGVRSVDSALKARKISARKMGSDYVWELLLNE